MSDDHWSTVSSPPVMLFHMMGERAVRIFRSIAKIMPQEARNYTHEQEKAFNIFLVKIVFISGSPGNGANVLKENILIWVWNNVTTCLLLFCTVAKDGEYLGDLGEVSSLNSHNLHIIITTPWGLEHDIGRCCADGLYRCLVRMQCRLLSSGDLKQWVMNMPSACRRVDSWAYQGGIVKCMKQSWQFPRGVG